MNYALLDNNIIVNVIVLTDESNYTPPEGCELIQIPANTAAGIGWTYTNGQFVAPPTPEPTPEPTLEQQRAARSNAYKEEADPLFFKSQRGEATIEEWKNKIEEIKLRYPYPI